MKNSPFLQLIAFLERLDEARVKYHLEHSRDDSVMVTVVSPGTYWEVEFMADGTVDVERFISTGHIEDESALEELLSKFTDEEPAVSHDSTSR